MSSLCRYAKRLSPLVLVALLTAHTGFAQVSGTVRTHAADQQNLPLPTAEVTIKAVASAWTQTGIANLEGEAIFPAVPVGHTVVTVMFEGFSPAERQIVVASNTITPSQCAIGHRRPCRNGRGGCLIQRVNPESSRTETLVGRNDIIRDPGADQSGSLAMITNNSPGAYMLHDHLHTRGGHGVSWEIDGVPVPSSAMAVVGSQFDPKDVDSLEVNRGGLSTNLGDRPYGVFNVVPRSGFEASRFGDVTATYGSHQLGNVHVAFGDHTADQTLAYFGSVSGSRTDRGLERVDIPVLHDAAHSVSGFASVVYNKSSNNQFRFIGASRSDRFEVPNTVGQQALEIDDREAGTDSFANLTWLHTSDTGTVVTVSPYYHFNRQQYIGGPQSPLVTSDNRASNYMGAYATVATIVGKHTVRVGTDSFAEHDDSLFGLRETTGLLRSADATGNPVVERDCPVCRGQLSPHLSADAQRRPALPTLRRNGHRACDQSAAGRRTCGAARRRAAWLVFALLPAPAHLDALGTSARFRIERGVRVPAGVRRA